MTLYNGYGNKIEITGESSSSSDFGVTGYAVYEDNEGTARQGYLTYQGHKFYVRNQQEQREDKVKVYSGGVGLFIGDSYTAYLNAKLSEFATKHGLVADNRGLASSTIAGSADGVTVGYHAFWVRLDEAIAEYQAGKTIDGNSYTCDDVKLITFMGGANDWATVNDTLNRFGEGANETNKETLYGALNYIFTTLLNTFPNADIVVILQPVFPTKTVPTTESGATDVGFSSLAQAQEMTDMQYSVYYHNRKQVIVKEMAERVGLPVCDCCFAWHNPINPTEKAKYWQDDGHLKDAGNVELIDDLEKFVNNLPFTRN